MFVDTQVRPQGEQQVGKLKLSEAIRVGARIRPQCRAVFWASGGSCAIGAAIEATGVEYGTIGFDFVKYLRKYFGKRINFYDQIYRRNDSGESREAIADWLEAQGF